MNKVCKQCESEKLVSEFRHQKRNDKMYISGTCKKCDTQNGKLRHPTWTWQIDHNNLDGVQRIHHRRS